MADNASSRSASAFSNNRKNFRNAVKTHARLLVSQSVSFQVSLRDLSATGFRFETANHIPLSRIVYLTMPGLEPLKAKVIWTEGEQYGCEFTRPLHASVFAHLSDKFPALAR